MIQVLIIDDDPMVADANKGYLESVTGFSCVGTAANATEAMAALETASVDLALLDIFMPGLSGLEVLREIRKTSRGIDVIVISAASDMHRIKTALRLGAVDYLIKPFEFERFHAALRAYQTEHHLMRAQHNLSQGELDAVFLHQEKPFVSTELPKGLTQCTLKTVLDQIHDMQSATFTTDLLANHVGLSRVSISKYLRFLTDIGFVTSTLHYRSIGRPVYHYQVNNEKAAMVSQYMEGMRSETPPTNDFNALSPHTQEGAIDPAD